MRPKRLIAAGLTAAGFILLGISLPAQDTMKARLSPVPADQKTRPELTGSGSVTAALAGTQLAINGSFDGLRSAATMAELRNGVAAGVRGPLVANLTITKATSGSISGSANLTAQQLTNFAKGGLYVLIFSEKTPEGVLWGWLLP
jgi:hypothetical protein